MSFVPPLSISGYLVSDLLGEGGCARVYRASTPDGRDVALKVAIRPEVVSALRKEGQVLRRLRHPRFVEILEERLDADPPCFVLELCPGGDLRGLVDASGGRLPPPRVEGIARSLLEGLAFAHDEGFVHGDLKPENVLLDGEGLPKIADFGLSRAHGSNPTDAPVQDSLATDVAPNRVRGTLDYLAPEVRSGTEPTPAADVFALGVLLYELLVGRRPQGAFKLPKEALASENVAVSTALDRIVGRALARDPLERYPDAGTMLADLDAGEVGLGAFRPRPVLVRAPRVTRQRRGGVLAGLIAFGSAPAALACTFLSIHAAKDLDPASGVALAFGGALAGIAWAWGVRSWVLAGLRT